MKKIRYFLEALFLSLIMLIFRVMPLDMASGAGGWLGRSIGPRLAASRKAMRNLHESLPQLGEEEQQKIITEMWDNLGRVMAEYPHLEEIGSKRVDVVYKGNTRQLIEQNTPSILVSAHIANWEISAAAMLALHGQPLDLTYRAPNNPMVDRLLNRRRSLGGQIRSYPKSRSGGQELVKAMREGHMIGMLIDQKYNEGIAVPFFGRPAMTNPVFVQLGRKFSAPIIPARIERLDGTRFRITLEEPLETEDRDTADIIGQAHRHLESWISEKPGQWLWLHRRWDSKKLEQLKEAA